LRVDELKTITRASLACVTPSHPSTRARPNWPSCCSGMRPWKKPTSAPGSAVCERLSTHSVEAGRGRRELTQVLLQKLDDLGRDDVAQLFKAVHRANQHVEVRELTLIVDR
jgi:hypothetical protein